jgi:hypothetical protein
MKLTILIFFILCLNLKTNLFAQTNIEGVWRGSSICQVKNSPCHDEQVVYYISKDARKNTFRVDANKIVNGKEDFMGELFFVYDSVKQTFICDDVERGARWEFQIKGQEMKGKLIHKDELFRLIDIKRDK